MPRRIPERAFVVLLSADGRSCDSEAFSRFLEERRQSGRDLCFVIGGPRGLDARACDMRLSLGPMTLPHQLARVVLLEQLLRGHKILARHPTTTESLASPRMADPVAQLARAVAETAASLRGGGSVDVPSLERPQKSGVRRLLHQRRDAARARARASRRARWRSGSGRRCPNGWAQR